jgi:hypothetical protein
VQIAHAARADDAYRVSGEIDLARQFPWIRQRVAVDRKASVVAFPAGFAATVVDSLGA